MDIKKVIRLLGPLIIDGVISVRNNSHERIVEMLHDLQFITRKIAVTSSQTIIELQLLDAEPFYRLLAGEANKFLLASMITRERSTQDQLKNASWQTIENYYAAYYGVHYLLRLTGVSVTNIDMRAIHAIQTSIYGAFPVPSSVPGGLYILKFDDTTQILTLIKNNKKSGGSHQEAWQLWVELVEKLSLQTQIDPVEYAPISVSLAEHKQFLIKSTAKYNPPEIRGEINYQFRGGAWVFEKDSSKSVGVLQRSIAGEVSLNTPGKATPHSLIANNKMIINLAKSVFTHSAEKYPKGICRALFNKYKIYI